MIRFETTKVVIGAILKSIPGLLNTFLFITMFWFVFGIAGVQWLSGLYSQCAIDQHSALSYNMEYSADEVAYHYNKTECDTTDGLIWTLSVYNFDNIFQSMHTLFLISTVCCGYYISINAKYELFFFI